MKLCILNNWCLPEFYPFCFPHQIRSGRTGTIPLLQTMTASKHSANLLKKLLEVDKKVELPKYLLLRDEGSGLSAMLPPRVLVPSSDFVFTETSDSFIVTKVHAEPQEEFHLQEKDIEESDSDSSDEEIDFTSYSTRNTHSSLPDISSLRLLIQKEHNYHAYPGISRTRRNEGGDQVELDVADSVTHNQVEQEYGSTEHYACGGGNSDGENPVEEDAEDRRDEEDMDRDEESGGMAFVPGGGGDDDGDDDGEDDDGEDEGDNDVDNDSEHGINRLDDENVLSQDILDLLPSDFEPGIDGMGARNIQQRQASSYYRKPWKFTNDEIQNLIRMTKGQFFKLVLTCVGAQVKKSGLNIFAQCFLMLLKLVHQISFATIATNFALTSSKVASDVFYRMLLHQYKTNCNIPAVLHNDVPYQPEVDKLLRGAYLRTPVFYKALLKDFEDPSGRNRTPVALNIDGTYFNLEGSGDIELQKYMFYSPRSAHVAKWINITDLDPKFVALLPVASSQTPSSGDGLLLAKHIELEDQSEHAQYIRTILRGNDDYFVILISDAGFVMTVPNAPAAARGPGAVTLAGVCQEEECVLLHTSNKYERYHLERTPQGKIRKIPWSEGNPTLDENTVKLTRSLRKCQEQIHAALKGKFKILDMRHLWNDSLLPLTPKQMEVFGLPPEYRDTPKLNFIATVCCSLLNELHPGFYPLYMDHAQMIRTARNFQQRLFLENPLLHPDIWPINFTAARTTNSDWVELTFQQLAENDVIRFPQLNEETINPIALELVSGPHALEKADSILTYMKQLLIKGQNLTREETNEALQSFPDNWKLQYMDIKAPPQFRPSSACPRWVPEWWDENRFGLWHDLRLVRCKIPPSYKSATNPANFHWVLIAFGAEPSDRLGLRPPYDTIYFWRCFQCQSLNGTLSMDRHLAALLKALSFKSLYRPTSKSVNLLNTVADPSRQTTRVLPPSFQSVDISASSVGRRRGTNRRLRLGGQLNPLYNLQFTPPPPSSTSHLVFASESDSNDNAESNENSENTQTQDHENVDSISNNITTSHNNDNDLSISNLAPDEVRLDNEDESDSTSIRERDNNSSSTNRRNRDSDRRNPDNQLERHIALLDPHNCYAIPAESLSQRHVGQVFTVRHLQTCGLLNDGNVCAVICAILCLHRLGIKDHLVDPHFCVNLNRTIDFPSCVFWKIMSALPSTHPFSIQLLINSWNDAGKTPAILPGFSDVADLLDGLIANLQLKRYASRPPVISEFLASFKCKQCGKYHDRVKTWESQIQSEVPLLQLPNTHEAVDVTNLLVEFLDEPIETRCTNVACRNRILDGKLEARPGFFTILSVNRFDDNDPTAKRLNKLKILRNTRVGQELLGELVSVICHRGSVDGGHFVSYHQVQGQWFLNDDSRQCRRVLNPTEDGTLAENETIETLFFVNSIQ